MTEQIMQYIKTAPHEVAILMPLCDFLIMAVAICVMVGLLIHNLRK